MSPQPRRPTSRAWASRVSGDARGSRLSLGGSVAASGIDAELGSLSQRGRVSIRLHRGLQRLDGARASLVNPITDEHRGAPLGGCALGAARDSEVGPRCCWCRDRTGRRAWLWKFQARRCVRPRWPRSAWHAPSDHIAVRRPQAWRQPPRRVACGHQCKARNPRPPSLEQGRQPGVLEARLLQSPHPCSSATRGRPRALRPPSFSA